MEKSAPALQNLPWIKVQTSTGPIVCMVRFLPEYQFHEGVLRGKTGDCESLNRSPLPPPDDREHQILDYSCKNKRPHPETEPHDPKHVRWEMIAEFPKMPLSSDVTLPLSTNSAKEESLDLSNYLPMPVLVKEESPKLADDNSMDGPPPLFLHGCSPLPPHLAPCQGTSPSPSSDRQQLLPAPRETGSGAPFDKDYVQEKTLDLRAHIRTLPVLTKREVPDHHFPATSPRHHPPASSSPLPRHQRRYRHHDYHRQQQQQHHHHQQQQQQQQQNDHNGDNASSESNHCYRRHLLTSGVTSQTEDTWLSHQENDGVLDLRMKRQCSPVFPNADHAPCSLETSPSLHNYIPTPLPPPAPASPPPPPPSHRRHPLPGPGNSSTAGSYHPHLNGTTIRQEHQEGLLDLRTRTRSPSPATTAPPPPPPPPPHHRSPHPPTPLIPLHPPKPPDHPVIQPHDNHHPHNIPHPAPTHLPPPPTLSAPLHHQLLQFNQALMRQFLESGGRRGDLLRSGGDLLRSGDGLPRSGGDLLRSGDGLPRSGGDLLRSGDGHLRSGDGLLRSGDGHLRSGDGHLRSGDGLLRSGDGLPRSGGDLLRSGDGHLRSGDGLLRSGDGLPRSGGDLLRSGDGHLRSGDGPLRSGDGHFRSGDGLLRSGDGHFRSGDGHLRSGDGHLRSGDGLLRSGDGHLRSGDGLLRSGDGLLRSGDGLLRSGDGLLRSGDGLLRDRGGLLRDGGRGLLRDGGGGLLQGDGRGLLRVDGSLPPGGGWGLDKPEEEDRLSMRANPPQHQRTIAPAPNYSPISSVSPHSDCHQNDDDDEEEEEGEEEKAEEEEEEEMREACVNETSTETDVVKAAVRKRPGRKKGQVSRVLHLWEFILELLRDPVCCPRIIHWENEREGVFRVLQSAEVARLWGEKKRNKKTMTYEKLSRSLRYSRKEGFFDSLPKGHSYPKKLCFKFGPRSHGWRNLNY